jgi:hypothetical protein
MKSTSEDIRKRTGLCIVLPVIASLAFFAGLSGCSSPSGGDGGDGDGDGDGTPDTRTWQVVGTAGFNISVIDFPDIGFGSSDTPYVAFYDGSNIKVTVMKFDGTNWVKVGDSFPSTNDLPRGIDLEFDSNKVPYVVYSRLSASNSLLALMKFNGTAWEQVGQDGFTSGNAYGPRLAFDKSDNPYVVFEDATTTPLYKASVMKYDSTSWILVGAAGISQGEALNPDIVVDSSNVPYIAYGDNGNSGKETVMKYNGTTWIAVGPAGFSADTAEDTDLEIDGNGILHVVYTASAEYPYHPATVMKFNGTDWVAVGTDVAIIAHESTIAFDSSNTPYVAYTTGKASAKRFNGTDWVAAGNLAFTTNDVEMIRLAINSKDVPYVVFKDFYTESSSWKATVMVLK